MSYIISADYKRVIQSDNLNQVIGSDLSLISGVELLAQSEAISYLTQKYDVSKEFTDTNIWAVATAYKGNQRVYLDAPIYLPSASYNINDLTLQLGNIYICIANTTGTFDINKWTLIGLQNKIFYVTLPNPEFNLYGIYKKGDVVFYKDKIYTCQIATIVYSHQSQLQQNNNSSILNIEPDSANGLQYWGAGTPYAVTAGTLPTITNKWTASDNRSQQLVQYCCDIALYHIHSRIAPRNIPDLRVKRYDEAIKWLRMAGKGEITPNLPIIQPLQGNRIRYASQIKQVNDY